MTRTTLIGAVCLVGCGRIDFDRYQSDATSRLDGPTSQLDGPTSQLDGPEQIVGCSDGERESFTDLAQFPTIAGCAATWSGAPSLRAAATGIACGDDVGPCNVPADACAAGWHVCASTGEPTDLNTRIDSAACFTAGGTTSGSYVAAMVHCMSCGACNAEQLCVYAVPEGCPSSGGYCTEPVCCGPDCSTANSCKLGAFTGGASIGAAGSICGAMIGGANTGVLCCTD